MKRAIKHYDPIFKENAVLLSYLRNTVKETAEELSVSAKILSKWRILYSKFGKGSFPGKGHRRAYYTNKKIYDLEIKSSESQLNLEILKKGLQYMHKGKHEICSFIYQNREKYPVYKMFEIFGTSHSTYYLWTKRPFSKTEIRVRMLKKEITSVFFQFKQYKGSVLISRELRNRGFQISDTQVSFYMKQLGLRSKTKKKFKATTDSKHNLYIAPNILNRQFKVDGPSKVWVSDITYIQTDKRFLYLTIIMDLYDRKIIGWHLSHGLSSKATTLPAFEKAAASRPVSKGLIFHSDKGVQYANKTFAGKLAEFNCLRSMGSTGVSIDNAVAESFFNTLKRELIYKNARLLSAMEMKNEISGYIEDWYNKKRIHSGLGNKNIEDFNAVNKGENEKSKKKL